MKADLTAVYTPKYSKGDNPRYRWSLEGRWGEGPLLCWIGLNPGIGDTNGGPRPTLHKVENIARSEHMGGVIVVNLFAYRCASLRALRAAKKAKEDIVGDHNDAAIRDAIGRAGLVLAAWGSGGSLLGRGAAVAAMAPDMRCLGVTRRGEPRHPLYVRNSAILTPYLAPAPCCDAPA